MNEEKPKPVCPICETEVADGEPRVTTKTGQTGHLECALVTVNEATKQKTPGLRGKLARERARKRYTAMERAGKRLEREKRKR